MFWDHLSDQGSYILCPPDTDSDEFLVYKTGLPILSAPDAPEAIPPDVDKNDDKEGEHPRIPLTNPWEVLTLTSRILMKMMMTFFYPLKCLQMTNKQATTHINFTSDQVLMGSLDITAAFLNAEPPAGRVVILPPTILYKLGLLPQVFCWKVNRAIYGLREAPSL